MASIEAVMAALALFDKMPQWKKEMTPEARKERGKIYELGLRKLTDQELLAASEEAIGCCEWFPTPAKLNELAKPRLVQDAQLRDKAEDAYQAVLAAYERGFHAGYMDIEGTHGRAAAQAFLAAGGDGVFSWCEPGPDQAFRQKRFIESYLLHAQAEEAVGQLGEPSKLAIGAGEATELLKKIGEQK